MKTKERELFELMDGLPEDPQNGLGVHENDMEEGFRVYHKDGYCFDIGREFICEPEEIEEYESVDDDGYAYEFSDIWDGFKDITIEKAIELIKK